MRAALLLAAALAACGDNIEYGADAAPPPPPPTCHEIAVAFCDVATACYPALSQRWCIEQERDLCAGWSVGADCLADTEALVCDGDALAVPCSCHPDQDAC